MKKAICIVIAVGMISTLCSCAANPNKDIVTGKGDGVFETRVLETSPENHNPSETQTMQHAEEFSSTDESVLFRLNIDEEVTAANMPVVEVVPRFVTEEEAEKIAHILFGDVVFTETRPRLVDLYSKDEILERLNRWEQMTDEETMKRLMDPSDDLQSEIDLVERFIEDYTKMLETAPDEDLNTPCQWTYKNSRYYWVSADEVEKGSHDLDEISADCYIDHIPFQFSILKRDDNDFKACSISAYIASPVGPDFYDKRFFQDILLRTEKPTQEQICAATEKAQSILDQIQLGDWMIDQVDVVGEELYTIKVSAVPAFNGVAAIWKAAGEREEYTSYYEVTYAELAFSADGQLVDFNLNSPLEITNIVNDNVAILSLEELMEKARTYLEHSDIYDYAERIGYNRTTLGTYKKKGVNLICSVDGISMEYNLTRIQKPNADNTYYYIPAISLTGNINLCFSRKGAEDEVETYENITLVVLNAVDGTVVNEVNS